MHAPKALALVILAGSIFTWPLIAADSPPRLREPFAHRTRATTPGSVLALWTFDDDEPLGDASSGGHLALQGGARPARQVRRSPPLEAGLAGRRPAPLRPSGPRAGSRRRCIHDRTLDRGRRTTRRRVPEAFLIDKIRQPRRLPVDSRSGGQARRADRACLPGIWRPFGQLALRPLKLAAGQWRHLAFTYDGRGTGLLPRWSPLGRRDGAGLRPGRARPALTIGDRNGSYYHDFPGGSTRCGSAAACSNSARGRRANLRSLGVRADGAGAVSDSTEANLCREPLTGAKAQIAVGDGMDPAESESELAPGKSFELAPDRYPPAARRSPSRSPSGPTNPSRSRPLRCLLRIVARQPKRMPVVMWGGIAERSGRARAIGFTHGLGVPAETGQVWEGASRPTRLTASAGSRRGQPR